VGVTLAGYCYAVRHGKIVKLVTPYLVSHLQRYGVTVRGNVTCVYLLLLISAATIEGHFEGKPPPDGHQGVLS